MKRMLVLAGLALTFAAPAQADTQSCSRVDPPRFCTRTLVNEEWHLHGRVGGIVYRFELDEKPFFPGRLTRHHGCDVSFARSGPNLIRFEFCDSPERRWWRVTLRAKTVEPVEFIWMRF